MSEDKHTEIMVALGKLQTKVDDGFQTTNTHLAQLNGKVATHEGRLNHMDVEDAKYNEVIKTIQESLKNGKTLKEKWTDLGIKVLVAAVTGLTLLVLGRTGVINFDKSPQTLEEVQERQIELSAEAQKLYLEATQNK